MLWRIDSSIEKATQSKRSENGRDPSVTEGRSNSVFSYSGVQGGWGDSLKAKSAQEPRWQSEDYRIFLGEDTQLTTSVALFADGYFEITVGNSDYGSVKELEQIIGNIQYSAFSMATKSDGEIVLDDYDRPWWPSLPVGHPPQQAVTPILLTEYSSEEKNDEVAIRYSMIPYLRMVVPEIPRSEIDGLSIRIGFVDQTNSRLEVFADFALGEFPNIVEELVRSKKMDAEHVDE